MNYRESAKFTPNLLMQHHEESMFEGELASPLREVKNITPNKNHQKKDRKNRAPKTFLSNSDNEAKQEGSPVNHSEMGSKLEESTIPQILPDNSVHEATHHAKNKLILDFSFDSEGEAAEEEAPQTETFEKKEQIEREEPLLNLNRVNVLDWTEGSEQEGDKEARVIDETSRKQNKSEAPTDNPPPSMLEEPVTAAMLFKTIPDKTTVHCIIRRDKKNNEGLIEYNVYLENNLKHILTIKKEGVWKYCIYIRFCKGAFFTYTKIAVIESNFLGSKFNLTRTNETNSELTISYATNLLGISGPRKLQIYIPKESLPFQDLNEAYDNSLASGKIEKCVNKSAKWNQKTKSYSLSFKGRAQQPSIKNFVISDKDEKDDSFFIIFGKAGPDIFNLDIESPFSLVQGIAVAISSFERKITCD